jgi:hypothetical protein
MDAPQPIVVAPGAGHRLGNVEFLARTADTPRFNLGIIEIAPGRELEAHVHTDEDDAFYILEGEMTFLFGGEAPRPRRAPSSSSRRGCATAFATTGRHRSGCSTSMRRAASTGGSGSTREPGRGYAGTVDRSAGASSSSST